MNKLNAVYEQALKITLRYKYYTEMYKTLVDYKDHNNTPLSNDKIQQAMNKVIAEEEVDERYITLDAHNLTMNTFCQSPVTTNTQGKNANAILTSEIINNLDALAETLKGLTIKDDGYYDS